MRGIASNILTIVVLAALPGVAHAGLVAIPVPEPASMGLLAVGAGALALLKFRKRK